MTAPWMKIARSCIGVREVPGKGSSAVIMGWANKLGAKILGAPYGSDAVPWCGLFAAWAVKSAGYATPLIPLRAKSWATWGEAGPAGIGAILVFQRDGGGHVGFYEAEDATAYRVLGGNQSDSVNVLRIAKDRCVAIRWPKGYAPKGARLVVKGQGPLSTNEA